MHETTGCFLGEERPVTVDYSWVHGEINIFRVLIVLIERGDYLSDGRYAPWVEWSVIDVKPILSVAQIEDLAREISESFCARYLDAA